ncbi:MAG: choice-of-anchor tandem repeat GloVer-containing protein [Candidatus Cybelea sp.]
MQPAIGAPATSAKASRTDRVAYRFPTTSSYRVLHRFGRHANASHDRGGANPKSGLINVGGTLYGTTEAGGYEDNGVVYSISTTGVKKVLYRFLSGGSDGSDPIGDLINVNGTMYGTTSGGGSCGPGTVYSISATGTEKVLHSFCGSAYGNNPTSGLINVNGTLYGTEGQDNSGDVYSISTSGTYKVLYVFQGSGNGFGPYAPLLNVNGTLYGTTLYGGSYCPSNFGCGTVYSVTTSGKEKVLYSFKGAPNDGWFPFAGLINVNGTLYGTTFFGGSPGCENNDGCGIVYSVTTSGAEKVLYRFTGGSDGGNPYSTLLEVNGTLSGTTSRGGTYGLGTVFSMSTSGSEQVLHSFNGSDGAHPDADSLIDVNGTLYGTTHVGGFKRGCTRDGNGTVGCGTVFALTP